MIEKEFRVMHSELIEYYQLIEMHLKGICAALFKNDEKTWLERLDDYESDPLGKLIQTIKTYQTENHFIVFSPEEYESLDYLRKRRNYWVHHCFSGTSPIIFRKGELRKPVFGKSITEDLQTAKDWEYKITEIGRKVIPRPQF